MRRDRFHSIPRQLSSYKSRRLRYKLCHLLDTFQINTSNALRQVAVLLSKLSATPEYGAAARSALSDDVTAALPACSQLTTLWSQLTAAEGEEGRSAELQLVLRAITGCRQVSARSVPRGGSRRRGAR